MRPRAFPFGQAFRDFVDAHERIFVIEQNRDAQFRSLMMIELGIDASKLISVLNYDGMPITADNIFRQDRRTGGRACSSATLIDSFSKLSYFETARRNSAA